ncbi:MAG TPA: uroporphyrinogen-III synthase [Chloroflexota bacterium]|jgi:uroporphyrinogen-III synthase|nr:uroporphyrinogen-III synthase [Chloroflexota bacterium]
MADLERRVVAFLEGRRAEELASLIERHNGVPLAAPCLREVHAPDSPILQAAIAGACQRSLDVAVFLTGVGTRTVFEAAAHGGLEEALRERLAEATVAVRGPKPTAALRQLGIRIDISAQPPHTSAELLAQLEPIELRDKRVLVQLYGEPHPELSKALTARGADVIELAPYVWERPIDPAPVLRLLDALASRAVDALLITSQAQVDNLFRIAEERGTTPRLDGVAIGVQGPVAEAALERHGYAATFRPEHGHMGALVLAAARYFAVEGVATR